MSERYKPFSEREGHTQPKPFQRSDMDRNLRVGLWNAFHNTLIDIRGINPFIWDGPNKWEYEMICFIWTDFINKPTDEFCEKNGRNCVKKIFLDGDWSHVYDLVEFIARYMLSHYGHPELGISDTFISLCNISLKKENSAYIIINGLVTPITNEQEIGSVEKACNAPYESVRKHLNQSLTLFADREQPDYPNSIKEAISAIESLAKEVTGKNKGALGGLVQKLPLQHPSFKKALHNLFGFTSDAGGIRHGEKPNENLPIDQNTARFMLVTCSAFINYIISQDSGLRNDKPEED